MIKLKAKLHWRTTAEGGRNNPAFAGIRPSFNVGDELIMCQIFPIDTNVDQMSLGCDFDVIIKLTYGETYREKIVIGRSYFIQDASRIIADARILAVID